MFKILLSFLILSVAPAPAFARTIQVVTGLIEKNGRVLLLRRSFEERLYPGFFSLPGGRVDADEAHATAVVREALEESGLRTQVIGIYNLWGWTSMIDGEPVKFEVTSYRLRLIEAADVILSSEHTEYVWASREDLVQTQITPELREDLEIAFGRKKTAAEICPRLLAFADNQPRRAFVLSKILSALAAMKPW